MTPTELDLEFAEFLAQGKTSEGFLGRRSCSLHPPPKSCTKLLKAIELLTESQIILKL